MLLTHVVRSMRTMDGGLGLDSPTSSCGRFSSIGTSTNEGTAAFIFCIWVDMFTALLRRNSR